MTDARTDAVLDALDDLVGALEENNRRNCLALERARQLRENRAKGLMYREIVLAEDRPLIVELIGQNLDALQRKGSRLRRAEARALHDEGLTTEQIAALFGVTRQRVSALLRDTRRL